MLLLKEVQQAKNICTFATVKMLRKISVCN